MQIDETQLASRAGTDVAMVRRLRGLGMLPATAQFDEALVPRVRFVVQLDQSGVSLEAMAKASRDGDLSIDFVDHMLLRVTDMVETTYQRIAAELGMSARFGEAVQIALGIDAFSVDRWVREDDVQTMQALAQLIELGVEEDVIIRLFEIMADNVRRMARATGEMWREGVHNPLLESGTSHRGLLAARSADNAQFQMIGERIVNLLWNRFLEEQVVRGTIETLKIALEESGNHAGVDDRPPAIVFLDLTAFTLRTARDGDELAAAEARNLAGIIRRRAVPAGGTLVKMLGDGAMLHFPNPGAAVRCSLALLDDIEAAGLPPGRCGVNAGPLIVRDVDFFGQTVNLAARLVDYARPGEVLVSSEAVRALDATTNDDLRFSEIGSVSLKGISSLVTVYSAQSAPPEG